MASRFWVGGTGTWDASDTTHWSGSSGGAGGQSVPGSSDTVTFDGSSGGGTVTVSTTVTIQSMTWGAFTGTIDNSANNNMTFTAAAGFNGSGSGARTFTGGTGTYTVSGASSSWTMTTVTNLSNPTTAFASCTITMSGVSATTQSSFAGSSLTYGTVNLNGNKGITLAGVSGTIATLGITGPNKVAFAQGSTVTITNPFAWNGSAANPIMFDSSNAGNGTAAITTGSGTANTATWCGFSHIVFTPVGGSTLVATNSADYGVNSGTGFTISVPSVGSAGVIGG